MNVKLSPLAREDIISILQYTYEKYGETQRLSYEQSIDNTLKMLIETPRLGRVYGQYRVVSVEKHSVYYIVDNDILHIVRVLHQRMDVRRRLPSHKESS